MINRDNIGINLIIVKGYESTGRNGCSVTSGRGLSASSSTDASSPEGPVQAVAESRHRPDRWYTYIIIKIILGWEYVLNWVRQQNKKTNKL